MADHISEEDSVLTRAIRDMTNNPLQANFKERGFPTPAQAYNAQRLEWMKLLDEVEPWTLPIFVENYPPRNDEGYGITSHAVDIPAGHALVNGQIIELPADVAAYVDARRAEGVEVKIEQVPASEQITKREDILRTANRLIHGDREQDYGRPIDSFRRVAAAFNLVLEGAGHPPIDATTAAKLMIALKLSRLAGGDNKDDTWIDLAGYAALGAEVRDQQ